MKKVLFALALALGMLFTSCQDKVFQYQVVSDDGRVIAVIHGIIDDGQTNLRLGGINVTYSKDGKVKTVQTDTSGYYAIKDLSSGEYELVFKSSTGNYVISKSSVWVPTMEEIRNNEWDVDSEDFATKKDVKISISNNMSMHQRNAGLTGTLYAMDVEGNLIPASGVTVVANFIPWNDIEPAVFTTTTDAQGVYMFDGNLPALTTRLSSLPFSLGSDNYLGAAIGDFGLTPNSNIKIADRVAGIDLLSARVLTSPFAMNDFPVDENISITFSKSFDMETVEIDLLRNATTPVYFETTWSNNNTTVTLNPFLSLRYATSYTVSFSGMDSDGLSFTLGGDHSFTTESLPPFNLIRTNLQVVEGQTYNDFPVNSDIELEFSVAVDTSMGWAINLTGGTPNATGITLSNGNKLVTLTNSILDADTNYNLFYNFNDSNGQNATGNIGFGTEQ